MKRVGLAICFILALPAFAQDDTSTADLLRTGGTTYERLDAGRSDDGGFWFKQEPWYTVTLYLNKEQAPRLLEPFRADTLDIAVTKEGFGKQIAEGGFDKVVVLTTLRAISSKDLRADFNDRLGKEIRVSSREMGSFNKCLKKNLAEGDQIRIAISGDGTISIASGEETCAGIPSQKLVNALFKMWGIGYDGSPKSAKDMAGLFTGVKSMLESGGTAAPANPQSTPVGSAAASQPVPATATPAQPAAGTKQQAKSRSDSGSKAGVLVCRKDGTTMRLEAPAGLLAEVRKIAYDMGYSASQCTFTPN